MNAATFALTPAAAHGEIWRLWTAHLVHYDCSHALTNAIAVAVPLGLVQLAARRTILLLLPITAPVISLLLLARGGFCEYRGASAIALAIWVFSALALLKGRDGRDHWTGAGLLLLTIVKLTAEVAGTGHLWAGIPTLPLAHVTGAATGVLAFIAPLAARTTEDASADDADQRR